MAALEVPAGPRPVEEDRLAVEQRTIADEAAGWLAWSQERRTAFARDRLAEAHGRATIERSEVDRLLAGTEPVIVTDTVVPFAGDMPWSEQFAGVEHPMVDWLLGLDEVALEAAVRASPPRPHADNGYALLIHDGHAAVVHRRARDARIAGAVSPMHGATALSGLLTTGRLLLGPVSALSSPLNPYVRTTPADAWPLFHSPWPLRLADVPYDLDTTDERDRYALALELECHRLRRKLIAVSAVLEDV